MRWNLLSAEKLFDSVEFQFVFMGHYPIMQRRKEQTVKDSLAAMTMRQIPYPTRLIKI